MRRHHIPESHGNHPNVTPLIDVVMCLIIFFMLVAKIGVAKGIDPSIEIPVSVLGQELKDPGNALTLNVRPGPGDEPMVTALVDMSSSEPQELKLTTSSGQNQLLEVLKRLREGDPKKNIAARTELRVVIRGDGEMDYSYLEKVLITCMQAKVKNVSFNTKKP